MILARLRELAQETAELLAFPMKGGFPPRIDLSIQNIRTTGSQLFELNRLQQFVQRRMEATHSPVVWGGYLEHRLIYNSSPLFHQEKHPRNIHLGLDFWAPAGTTVFAPLAATVHSFQDNAAFRDYGPTIILRHEVPGLTFHSLYGHLSRASLTGLKEGMEIPKGSKIGELGAVEENGQWPPHLHFQLILDMKGHIGDYPGVCAIEELRHFVPNCPDPRFLLGI